jgi:class 3 adenylate cyclase
VNDPNANSLVILFADVSDSTRLYEALGDAAAFGQIQQCVGALKSVALASGGRVVKTIGDAAMCVFPTPDAAAHAACGMQERIAELRAAQGTRIAIRVGFHFGPVLEDGNDVFGDSVNVAARMSGLAAGSQIMTTGDTVAHLSGRMRQAVRRVDALTVKGRQEEVDIYELVWATDSDRTLVPGRASAEPATQPGFAVLRLKYLGQTFDVRDFATLGRGRDNSLVVSDAMASRQHAKIELRRGKFVLSDFSMNGTWVTGSDGRELRLHREETILLGAGRIAFGHPTTAPDTECVHYECTFDV